MPHSFGDRAAILLRFHGTLSAPDSRGACRHTRWPRAPKTPHTVRWSAQKVTDTEPTLATNPDYTLRWPPALFVQEATVLVARGELRGTNCAWSDEVELLLRQAFASQGVADDFTHVSNTWEQHMDSRLVSDNVWNPVVWLSELAADASSLDQEPFHQPYYSQRKIIEVSSSDSALVQTISHVVTLVRKFYKDSYFDKILGTDCVDTGERRVSSPEHELRHRVGKEHLWTAEPEVWTEEDLFDFIEVFHDITARPVARQYHEYGDCGWHVTKFCVRSGQALYRWRVNQILDNALLGFVLSESGDDVGRIVKCTPDGLGQLIDEPFSNHEDSGHQVRHAISRFRHRVATREDQRLAIHTLAGILEQNRPILKKHLLSKDESSLFEIANKFHIRHQKADQYSDYGVQFLEWIFYWYLATVHLADQILAERSGSTSEQ